MLDQPGDPALTPHDSPAEPGATLRSPPWLVALAVSLVAIVGILQRPSLFGAAASGPRMVTAPDAPPPRTEMLEAFARIAVGLDQLSPGGGRMVMAGGVGMAESGADAVRLALLDYDLSGPEVAMAALDAAERKWLEAPLDASTPEGAAREALRADADACRLLFSEGPTALPPPDRERLERRHGWFGRLALTRDLPDTDPQRETLIRPAVQLAIFMSVVGLGFGAAVLAGIGFLIAAVVLAASGRLRIAHEPGPASRVMLETFVLFLAGFLAVKMIAAVVAQTLPSGHPGVIWTVLGLQWSLVLVPLWPLVRRRHAGHSRLGWNRGRGVLREAMIGACGWSACLPLLLIAAVMSMLLGYALESLGGKAAGGPVPRNPVMDLVGRGGMLETIVTASMVVVWAPLVEESVFRGALLRSLRGRLRSVAGFVVAGAISAFAFGIVHAYPIHLLPVVMALGFGFAFLREWRGTLIPSATAHFIQNTMAFTVLMVLSRLGGL